MALVALVALLAAGCATARPTPTPIEMEGMRFAAVEVDGSRRVEVLDAETLFQEAGRAFEGQDYAVAAARYGLLVEHFPESRFFIASLYNGALSLERSGRCDEAVPGYEEVARRTAGSRDAHDALFRQAACHQTAEAWDAMAASLDRVLRPEYARISTGDSLQAHALRGLARQRGGDLALAERDFLAALKLYRRHIDQPVLDSDGYVSMAQYQIGEIYRELAGGIRFRLPVDRMMRDLEDKSNLFLKAQNAYLRTVRLQHPDFAVKAGYRLGALYETFYDDMLAAEVPAELDAEEVEVYFEELRKKIRPLIVTAIDIYERNLRLGQRMGRGTDDWVRRTEASLSRLEEVLRDDTSRQALVGMQ